MSLVRLPDAPYIREAEHEGWPGEPEMTCPVCGVACEHIFKFADGRAVGCDQCGDFMLSWGLFPEINKEG